MQNVLKSEDRSGGGGGDDSAASEGVLLDTIRNLGWTGAHRGKSKTRHVTSNWDSSQLAKTGKILFHYFK